MRIDRVGRPSENIESAHVTEELRALAWDHVVAYAEDAERWIPVQEVGWEHDVYAMYVWRSVRKKGDTKTSSPAAP